MKVLFFMRSSIYVRNFESTLRLLAERGHDVHVVATPHRVLDPTDLIGRLCRECPRITYGPPPQHTTQWPDLGYDLRRALDYLRYLEPEFRDAVKLRRRAERKSPALLLKALRRPLARRRVARTLLRQIINSCDRAVPRDPAVDAHVRRHRPDLVLVTPLLETGSPQSDYLRSARALGVPTGLCVHSWDNLTTKGLIHDRLDVVTVWNQAMKEEAVALHHVPADRVVVTGAAPYDHWFTWQVRSARDVFCARAGLDPSRPYLLYLCSSKFVAPNELPFIRQWIEEIRAASHVLRDAGVLVRPHPQNADSDVWQEADLAGLGNVTIWPRTGGNPIDADSRADYYDSIYHSAAVVGVNTSAQIESAIAGRGVYTLLAPEFRETQGGTLHFRHLRDVSGGLLHVASGLADHVKQLEGAVCNPQRAAERGRRFVEAFVRPFGIDEPATPRLVAALETTAARGRRRADRGPWWAGLARPALAKIAIAFQAAEQARGPLPAKPARGNGPQEPKEKRREAKAMRHEQKKMRAARETLQPVHARSGERRIDAFEHYVRVRECARQLRAADLAEEALTPSERRMRSELAPMWDASPEVVTHLRRHCHAISGVRPADYEAAVPAVQARLEQELMRLLDYGDRGLWVDEPTALGGFGFDDLGKHYNEDTLRFFRVISLLQDAAVLRDFRSSGARRTVWEIGGGWGGFAYHLKSVCPNVTYLITGAPELLLLSAVYVSALWPAPRVRFYDPARPDAFFQDWDQVDFAFAPESVVGTMRLPTPELVVDLMTLERMRQQRIDLHIREAYEAGARYFVSLCPSADAGGGDRSPVRNAIERWYWPHPVSAPKYLAKRLAVRSGRQVAIKHTYFVGWRRLRAHEL